MSIERPLENEKIIAALEKGQKRAFEFLASNPSLVDLKKEFEKVARATRMLLDNFDQQKFIEREHPNAKYALLQKMLLVVFEAVQRAYFFESSINSIPNTSSLLEGKALNLQIELLKAVSVYRTNGDQNLYAFDVQQMINQSRGDQTGPPYLPSDTPVVAA